MSAKTAGQTGRQTGRLTGSAGWLVALALMAITAAGCSSGGGTDAMSASDSGGDLTAEKAVGPASAPSAAADASAKRQSANRVAVRTQAVINTGTATLLANDLDRTRDELERLAQQHGGFIASEQSTSDRAGRIQSASMELRVPATDFATVLDGLRDIATVRHVRTTSEDVTTQVIDVDSRVRSMRTSLIQLRKLLSRSTDVATMLQIESDITTREAELESALAQQRYLADQTAMSTLNLELQRPPRAATPAPDHDEGFLAGLRGGWEALAASAVVLLTIVGAVLPFAVLLLLVGVPVWLLVRRLVRRPQQAVAGQVAQPEEPRQP
jgi:hypothetical protein